MECPICGGEMREGGLLAKGYIEWIPKEEFDKFKLFYDEEILIGDYGLLFERVKLPNAYLCRKCKKIVGIFDIKRRKK